MRRRRRHRPHPAHSLPNSQSQAQTFQSRQHPRLYRLVPAARQPASPRFPEIPGDSRRFSEILAWSRRRVYQSKSTCARPTGDGGRPGRTARPPLRVSPGLCALHGATTRRRRARSCGTRFAGGSHQGRLRAVRRDPSGFASPRGLVPCSHCSGRFRARFAGGAAAGYSARVRSGWKAGMCLAGSNFSILAATVMPFHSARYITPPSPSPMTSPK